jgi:hypothetical protein
MPDTRTVKKIFNPLNAKLNPICHFLALLGAHPIPHVSRIRVNWKPLIKRSQGRPKYRWEDNITQDICQMKIKNWIACVQDRGKWEEIIEKAKTFN